MTSAPQSARWRTQVGPARASVRSSTTTPASGFSEDNSGSVIDGSDGDFGLIRLSAALGSTELSH